MKLRGKIAIVTGAASGIGKAIAECLADEGAKVAIVDINEGKAREVAGKINKAGKRAIAIKADVSYGDQVEHMVKATLDEFRGINILVNNAGIVLQAKVVETREEDWDRILRNNLKSCFLCSRDVAKQMIKQGKGGKIINISSIVAKISLPSGGSYVAAKGGMEAFSRTLATELAPYKINVNVIEPGATYTEFTVPMYTESVKKALCQRIPLKEIAQPEWIAAGVLFLASDDAHYITGQTLTIDGGYIMDGSLLGATYWEE